MSDTPRQQNTAKQYNRTKLIFGLCSSALSFAVLAGILILELSKEIQHWAFGISSHPYLAAILFAAAISVITGVTTLPLRYYSSFVVEHRYNLSNQTIGRWAWERLKGMLVGAPLMIAVVVLLYYCLNRFGETWWLPVSIVLMFFSVVLARIAPTFIMPLFYRFTPIAEGSLRERITALCQKSGVRFNGIFSFNLSKNTKKANAAFTGIGKSKRILLGDTLLSAFSEDEIETVFAHELGHYKHRHMLIGIVVSMISTTGGLFITSKLYSASIGWFGFSSITELAALPLLGLWLSLFGLVTSPLGNMLSRRHEREADTYAVRTTGNAAAFTSALRKLAESNLADPEPHPLVEFLFYSHPSIARRIALVQSLDVR